jgi:4-amino-4-deoxy-L-arabinose transferase-like glycosyltransferase
MVPPLVFRVAVAALIAALTIPRMAQRGMFGDGLLYATIARNLSIGSGSFWAPRYTETAWPEFYEHPPLGLALQAAAFGLLGDHLIVERAFSLIVFALHALVIAAIWRRVHPAAFDWLPLLFWIVPSIVTWGAVNNMLENTQALFTSTAVLLFLAAIRAPDATAIVTRSAIAGVAVVAAVLTKGPAGFFPLAAPLLFRLLLDARRKTDAPRQPWRLATVTSCLVVAAFSIALAVYPPSRHNLTMYFGTQLAPAVQGLREISDPLALVRHIGVGIVGRMTALLALCWWLGRRRDRAAGPADAADLDMADMARPAAWARCFLALGLCAAGPIAFSPKVAGHYFLPAIPMFALGFSSIAHGFVASRVAARLRRPTLAPDALQPALRAEPAAMASAAMASAPILFVSCTLAVIITLVFVFGRGGSRDAAMLHDLDAIDRAMPRGLTIGACGHPRSSRDWGLHTYTQRWFRVSLDARDMPINGWLLRTEAECAVPTSCVPVARGNTLTLFRCPDRKPRVSATASSR